MRIVTDKRHNEDSVYNLKINWWIPFLYHYASVGFSQNAVTDSIVPVIRGEKTQTLDVYWLGQDHPAYKTEALVLQTF